MTAETFVPGGTPFPRGGLARASAEAFARLIALAPAPDEVPSVDPSPPWVGWDHGSEDLWPLPDDDVGDLNDAPRSWIDDAAVLVRERLLSVARSRVIGHADWWTENVLWRGDVLHVVHDWDSVACQPEAALVGAAAGIFAATKEPGHESGVEESEVFLAAYENARGASFSPEEREVAWASGLWVRLFDAKKESVTGGSARQARLRPQLEYRLLESGLGLPR